MKNPKLQFDSKWFVIDAPEIIDRTSPKIKGPVLTEMGDTRAIPRSPLQSPTMGGEEPRNSKDINLETIL